MNEPTTPEPRRLGDFEIVREIGRGGMGVVYEARQISLQRKVAVKVLSEPLANRPDALARFEREARAIAALAHPNILAIHEIGMHEGVRFAVTELLEGETLRVRLRGPPAPYARSGGRPLSWRKAVEIGRAVADGLAAAHARGVIHRDLNPENIFITNDGVVKILDSGLARIRRIGLTPRGASSAGGTSTSQVTTEPEERP